MDVISAEPTFGEILSWDGLRKSIKNVLSIKIDNYIIGECSRR
jgi:hypothetical protein